MATNLTQIKKDTPFAFGVDANNNYGYIKAGADTVTPFKTDPSGNIDLGEYTKNGDWTKNVSGYATCSFKVSAGLTETTLWTNDTPSNAFPEKDITLNQQYTNFTFIGIESQYSRSATSERIINIFRSEDIPKFVAFRGEKQEHGIFGGRRITVDDESHCYVRIFYAKSTTSFNISITHTLSYGGDDDAKSVYIIPTRVIGYKAGG